MANLASSRSVSFLDIETTHLDPSRSAILEITIITDWEGGRQDIWTTKIKPRPIELEFANPKALEICKYSDDDWSQAPSFEEVAPEIISRLIWGPIVGHNVHFDISHIRSCLARYKYKEVSDARDVDQKEKVFKIGYPIIDTCSLSFVFLPTQRQNLNALREHFGISQDRAHASLTDAEDCREIFYQIVQGHIDSFSV
jgi:DNA polymerase III epsilon subunit-like protein